MLEVIRSDVAENKNMRDYIIACMLTQDSLSCSRKHEGPFSPRMVSSWCQVGLPPPECRTLGYEGLTSP